MNYFNCRAPIGHEDTCHRNRRRVLKPPYALKTDLPSSGWPRPESLESFRALMNSNVRRARHRVRVYVAFLLMVSIAVWFGSGQSGWATFFAFALATWTGGAFRVGTGLSASQYYSIPHSQTGGGKPRCIHCGHVGLYTHGAYATNTKYHDCSRCGMTLYYS